MKRIISALFFIALFLLTPNAAYALSTCPSFETNPSYTTWRSDTDITSISNITIGVDGSEGEKVVVKVENTSPPFKKTDLAEITVRNSKVSFNPNDGKKETHSSFLTGYGKHIITVFKRSESNAGWDPRTWLDDTPKQDLCSFEYSVLPHYTCGINNITGNNEDYRLSYGQNDPIKIKGTFYNPDNDSERPPSDWKMDVRVFDNMGNEYRRVDIDNSDGKGNFETTVYTPSPITDAHVGVWKITASPDGKGKFDEQTCTQGIYVSKIHGETPPPATSSFLVSSNQFNLPKGTTNTSFFGMSDTNNGPTPTDPCPLVKESNGKNVNVCDTALGPINVSGMMGIISELFKLIVSIAGVGAVILLIVGGYRIMISRGDKEKLQGGRETITSALIGLVFIILSFVILQIIGVDILGIPQFKP